MGQASPPPFDWGSLAGSAVGSSPAAIILAWRLTKQDGDNRALREEVRVLNQENRQMTERVASALVTAGQTMADVRAGMEATLERPRTRTDTDRLVQQLQDVVRDAERDRDRRRGDR